MYFRGWFRWNKWEQIWINTPGRLPYPMPIYSEPDQHARHMIRDIVLDSVYTTMQFISDDLVRSIPNGKR